MRIATIVGTSVGLFVMMQAVEAAPKVSGTYALMAFTQCQAKLIAKTEKYISQISPASGQGPGLHNHSPNFLPAIATLTPGLGPVSSGEISMSVGTFKFPNTAASSGNATLELSVVSGASVTFQRDQTRFGVPIHVHPEGASDNYTITNTSFQFGAMTWAMRPGNIVDGVARTLYMVRRENERCVQGFTATKQ